MRNRRVLMGEKGTKKTCPYCGREYTVDVTGGGARTTQYGKTSEGCYDCLGVDPQEEIDTPVMDIFYGGGRMKYRGR